MNEAIENVLIPTCDELLFKTYGLSLVTHMSHAYNLLTMVK